MQQRRIYLDNAATSWPKPEAVYVAVDDYLRRLGAPAGRGSYGEADEVQRSVDQTRRRLAKLIGADEPDRVVFTHNGTDSLNIVLHGVLRSGDHAISTVVDHNSTLRPLRYLQQHGNVQVTRVPCDGAGIVDPDVVRKSIQPNTRLIAIVHASNVTGAVQPIEPIRNIARQHNLLLLVDAAQTLGHWPVNVQQLGADFLAAPSHKALLGPLGGGVLYIAPQRERELLPLRRGGTGTQSEVDEQPEQLPYKYESGNLNVPAIVGLQAGLQYLAERGIDAMCRHHQELTERLVERLRAIDGVQLHGPSDPAKQVGVVSLTLAGYDPRELATLLDTTYRIQTRAGFHCAPLAHQALGTDRQGGTLRMSLGAFNTQEEIDLAADAVREITEASVGMHQSSRHAQGDSI